MGKIFVEGGHSLNGKIEISGMKNSALPIIFACLLVEGDCILENIPRVSDVQNSLTILKKMGADADFIDEHTIKINTKNASASSLDFELISKMRASSYLMSTCLRRFGNILMPYPGGCNFGSRPIEQHIKGFEALGAKCILDDEVVSLKCDKMISNAKIVLDKISVGATINMIMASVIGDGETVIENVAKEPHVLDVVSFLNICGADIRVFDNKIRVVGVNKLKGIRYKIYSDMIEALTFVCCLGVAGGEIALQNAEYDHLLCVLPLFEKIGIHHRFTNGNLYFKREKTPIGASVVTAPYPAFPTDLHPQFSSLLCYCEGGGSVTEQIFPNRFAYVDELRKMGAKISRISNKVTIEKATLNASCIDATDLRAGAALIVASLGADGISTINNVDYILRGYEGLVSKLEAVGAHISWDIK